MVKSSNRAPFGSAARKAHQRAAFVAAGGFIAVTGAAVSAQVESNIVTMANLSGSPAMTISGGQYSKNGGAYSSAATTVTNGDTVRMRVTSSADNATATTATLTIGGTPRTFVVTTLAAAGDVPAIAFASPSVSIAEGNSATTTVSNTLNVTRNGVTGALVVNLTYGGTATGGVDYATAPVSATIPSGQNSVSFDIQVNGDATVEADETIIITATLVAYPSVTAGKTITITNDDSAPVVSSNLLISTSFPNAVPVIGYVENVQAGEAVTCNVPGITLGTQSGSLIPYSGTPSGGAATIANAFVSVLGGVTTSYSRDVILAPSLDRVTVLGDSMGAGDAATTAANRFVNRFATAAGTTPRNVGIGGTVLQNTGAKANNGRDRFMTACNVPKNREVLLLEYGGFNDVSAIADGLTAALYKSDLEEVVIGLRGLGWQPSQIMLMTMFWQTDARVAGKPYTRADIAAYNQAVKDVAYAYGLPLADVHYATLDRSDLIDADLTHPNDTGHNVFYQTCRGAAVRNPNPFPTKLTQQVVSATSFTAGWTAPVGKTVTNYTFQYGVDGDFSFPNSQTLTGTTVTPTGLTSGTAYHWRVRANFSDGSFSRWQIGDGYIKPQASANVTSGSVTGLAGVADGTALTATTPATGAWSVPWGQGALRVLGERIVPASGGGASTDILCNIPWVNDGVYGETIIDVKTNGSGLQTQIILRGNDTVATAGDFNALAAMYGNGGVNIYAITGGTSTVIATASIGGLSVGEHRMRFEVQRRQQRLYIDDVLVAWGAEDDGALPANLGGNCGMRSIGAITASLGPTVKTVKFGTL